MLIAELSGKGVSVWKKAVKTEGNLSLTGV